MAATIGDPFLLASYSLPSRLARHKQSDAAADVSVLYASHCALPRHAEGQVVTAAQGDGLHVIDLAALHPVSSYTLGPSVTFACAPTSSIVTDKAQAVRRTLVAIDSAPDIQAEHRRRTVWEWKEGITDDIGAIERERRSYVAAHYVSHIIMPESPSPDVVLLSPEGEMTHMDADFGVQNRWKPVRPQRLIRAFVFARQRCPFVSLNDALSARSIILLFLHREDQLRIEILALTKNDLWVLDVRNAFMTAKDVVDVSCDESGHFSVLTRDGVWNPGFIDLNNGKTELICSLESIHLRDLSFINRKLSISSDNMKQVSLLPLGSSHTLVAALTTSPTPEIALLLWDAQYCTLLDSHLLPVPSSLPKSDFSISLIAGSPSQALLSLCPLSSAFKARSKSDTTSYRSSIFAIPFSVPSTSTILNSMGRSIPTLVWNNIQRQTSILASGSGWSNDSSELSREKLLHDLQQAMDRHELQNAEKFFFDWLEQETTKSKKEKEKYADVNDWDIDEVEMQEEETAIGMTEKKSSSKEPKVETKVSLDHKFVSHILQIILHHGKSAGTPHCTKILRTLLERRVVSHSMIGGGLLSALAARGDWESIRICMYSVIDIPESDIIRLLALVVGSYRLVKAKKASDPDTMALDETASAPMPPPSTFLASCLPYPSTPAFLRIAVRQLLSDVDDLICILEILEAWLAQWQIQDLVLAFQDITVTEKGVPVAKTPRRTRKAERKRAAILPDMEYILTFLQAITDSSLIILLQYPPSHDILRRIQSHLGPQIAYNSGLEQLRGFLEPFAKAQKKALRETNGRRRHEPEGDWRQRRKQARDQGELAVGLYQVEDLAF